MTNHILRENTPHRREAALIHLAVKEKVSASTQNQAHSALQFLYQHVIGRERRIAMLPESLKTPIQDHLKKAKTIHERDFPHSFATNPHARCGHNEG
ncbi:MAG: phage integrase N-terminal SAM-like domain-containing protein [Deltaproteobacteria bacterium]|nr:phage integrase N-terminal SAM-like domain-containing protein [Deltaproteobacteria bacterium]